MALPSPPRLSPALPRAVAVLSVLGVFSAGCAGPSVGVSAVPPSARFAAVLAMHTAGYVGCPHAEITIVDYHVARLDRAVGEPPISETWTARCRGATFVCSSTTSARIACTPELRPEASAASPSAAPGAGVSR